jgi:hypothetical protein
MKKILNEDNQIHNFISSSGSGTIISYGSGSTSQKVTVNTVPVPVPQHCLYLQRCTSTSTLFLASDSHLPIFKTLIFYFSL